MNREDIIRMAREAGLEIVHFTSTPEAIERFAALVAAAEREKNYALIETLIEAEREACAKLCEDEAEKWEGDDGPISTEARLCAINIRARGEK